MAICTVWSLSDALQLQTLLDRAGIPFFMGPEKATGVEAVTSDFVNGVSVQVMRIGLPWTRQPLSNYMPVNEPDPKQEEVLDELPVRCPRCQSTEVIFEGLIAQPARTKDNSSPQYEWTCDSCGHQWKDNGIAKEESMPDLSLQIAALTALTTNDGRTPVRYQARTAFSIRSVFQVYAFVKSLHGSGLPGLIPSWISLKREKDNFILSFL